MPTGRVHPSSSFSHFSLLLSSSCFLHPRSIPSCSELLFLIILFCSVVVSYPSSPNPSRHSLFFFLFIFIFIFSINNPHTKNSHTTHTYPHSKPPANYSNPSPPQTHTHNHPCRDYTPMAHEFSHAKPSSPDLAHGNHY